MCHIPNYYSIPHLLSHIFCICWSDDNVLQDGKKSSSVTDEAQGFSLHADFFKSSKKELGELLARLLAEDRHQMAGSSGRFSLTLKPALHPGKKPLKKDSTCGGPAESKPMLFMGQLSCSSEVYTLFSTHCKFVSLNILSL